MTFRPDVGDGVFVTEDLGAGIRALYASGPDRFVDERNALAARLRGEGDDASAKRIAALKKPTVAAWAVDQLSAADAGTLEQLIDVGHRLAAAQRQVSAPGGADRLREIAATRSRLIDELARSAERALSDAGMPAARATLEKVTNTLMAIATDDAAAERVRSGILDKELPAPSGFGDERLDSALLASVTELTSRSDPGETEPTAAERRAKERLDRLIAEADRLVKDADELEREAVRARRVADAAAKEAEAGRKKADAARRRADQAGEP